MADRKKRSSAVLGMLSQEGAAGRLVSAPEPEPRTPETERRENTASSHDTKVSASDRALTAIPQVERKAEPVQAPPVESTPASTSNEWPTEEQRDAMSIAELAALPAPPRSRKNYKSESQTLRVFPHSAEAIRRGWIEARLGGRPLLSYTEFASEVVARGLKAMEDS